jgi:hypothetical protein
VFLQYKEDGEKIFHGYIDTAVSVDIDHSAVDGVIVV